MKKLILTSDKFTGELAVIYDEHGMLRMFDAQGAEMTAQMIDYFKRHVPVVIASVDEFKKIFHTLTVTDSDHEVSFEMFWNKYSKKINGKRCLGIWDKMSKTKRVSAYFGIDPYFRYLETESWRTKADPETYLKKEYWLNDWTVAETSNGFLRDKNSYK